MRRPSDAVIRGRTRLEALRRQAFLNARLFAPDRRGLLAGDRDLLADGLLDAAFTQREAGDLLGFSKRGVATA